MYLFFLLNYSRCPIWVPIISWSTYSPAARNAVCTLPHYSPLFPYGRVMLQYHHSKWLTEIRVQSMILLCQVGQPCGVNLLKRAPRVRSRLDFLWGMSLLNLFSSLHYFSHSLTCFIFFLKSNSSIYICTQIPVWGSASRKFNLIWFRSGPKKHSLRMGF